MQSSVNSYYTSKIEKVPRDVRSEHSGKNYDKYNITSPKWDGARCPEEQPKSTLR